MYDIDKYCFKLYSWNVTNNISNQMQYQIIPHSAFRDQNIQYERTVNTLILNKNVYIYCLVMRS